ncbi:unnamed protein product [Rotaria sordida]|uniref:Uncharacterized protein n=1 Tax=Rotaria sordida TaxID=392033 RepID=A0A819YFY1_9BILA|nr:unnamed protein product [Rotaria sordida]CAF4152597.1 unnamed protein product [Rotaria sordida]
MSKYWIIYYYWTFNRCKKFKNDMMNISKEFFHLPLSIKREITDSKDYPSSSNLLSDLKESFSIEPKHEGEIRWPTKPLKNIFNFVKLL